MFSAKMQINAWLGVLSFVGGMFYREWGYPGHFQPKDDFQATDYP